MSCEGCAQAVTRAIRKAAPDAKVEVDLASGEVAVEGRAAECAVAAAIEWETITHRRSAQGDVDPDDELIDGHAAVTNVLLAGAAGADAR